MNILYLRVVVCVGCLVSWIGCGIAPEAEQAVVEWAVDEVRGCGGLECGVWEVCEAEACVCAHGVSAITGRCMPPGAAIWLPGLPGVVAHHWLQPGAAHIDAVSELGPPIVELIEHDCPFTLSVDPAGRMFWRCEAPSVCEATLRARVGDQVSEPGVLTVRCEELPATITARGALRAPEGERLQISLTCDDPDRARITWSVLPEDTCGGMFQSHEASAGYVIPLVDELMGGTSCVAAVACDDGGAGARWVETLSFVETNTPPHVTSASGRVRVGEEGVVGFGALDDDVPEQPVTLSLEEACPFPVAFDAMTRQISWRCEVEEPVACVVTIVARDGEGASRSPVSLICSRY